MATTSSRASRRWASTTTRPPSTGPSAPSRRRATVYSYWNTSSTGPARRMYRLTPAGEEQLQAAVEALAETHLAIERYLCRHALAQSRAAEREDDENLRRDPGHRAWRPCGGPYGDRRGPGVRPAGRARAGPGGERRARSPGPATPWRPGSTGAGSCWSSATAAAPPTPSTSPWSSSTPSSSGSGRCPPCRWPTTPPSSPGWPSGTGSAEVFAHQLRQLADPRRHRPRRVCGRVLRQRAAGAWRRPGALGLLTVALAGRRRRAPAASPAVDHVLRGPVRRSPDRQGDPRHDLPRAVGAGARLLRAARACSAGRSAVTTADARRPCPSRATDDVCITCGDVAVPVRVVELLAGRPGPGRHRAGPWRRSAWPSSTATVGGRGPGPRQGGDRRASRSRTAP